MVFTSVGHLLDVDLLREAYGRTRKDASAGIDGQTAEDYGKDLKRNLEGLVARLKAKRYRAPAVRRTYIPKGQGNEMRPIGIPTFEDKVLQRAVAMILEAIYEPIFSDDSYGFRPGRGCHDALQVMRERIMSMRGYWVIEVDIRKFFDSLDHSQLMAILRRRVRDGTVLRLIGKWLKAGVLDKETLFFPGAGTPQGGVISPILGNIYLHTVLDEWFHELVRPVLHGRAFLVRYADDFVMGFEREDDADRVLRTLPLRFEKYGLRLHPLKTGQIDFRPPWRRRQEKCPQPRPRRSFDFLGFTVYWGRTRRGRHAVKLKTASDRLARAIRTLNGWCKRCRHAPIPWQHKRLVQKLHGHYNYYGVPTNWRRLSAVLFLATRTWRKWLQRRSHKGRSSWERWKRRVLDRFPLPAPHLARRYQASVANP